MSLQGCIVLTPSICLPTNDTENSRWYFPLRSVSQRNLQMPPEAVWERFTDGCIVTTMCDKTQRRDSIFKPLSDWKYRMYNSTLTCDPKSRRPDWNVYIYILTSQPLSRHDTFPYLLSVSSL